MFSLKAVELYTILLPHRYRLASLLGRMRRRGGAIQVVSNFDDQYVRTLMIDTLDL